VSSTAAQRFLFEAAREDGVEVGADEEVLVARCADHTDEQIDTEIVHELADKHALDVERSVADFDEGVVRVYIAAPGGDADGE
jgi:uncharacterized protein YgbK (DUF1537 family)